jgi:anti-anti-sigma factor
VALLNRRATEQPSHDIGGVTGREDGYLTCVTVLLPGGNTPVPRRGAVETEAAPILQVELDVQGPACSLTLRGELCGGSLAALTAQVDQLVCLPCERVVVNMGQVTRLDQAGAKVILGLYYYVLGKGGVLRVTGLAGQVAETLRAAGGELLAEDGFA